ncbi:MAG TPA: FmdB family zinc ribbon protein [Pseudolysinimonas sp.]
MPTYSYRCTDCGEAFDIQQAFTDDTLTVCPNCGGSLRKLFNTVGVTFNGSGFYRTDSRANPKSESAAAGSTPSPASSPTSSPAPSRSTAAAATSTSTSTSAKE